MLQNLLPAEIFTYALVFSRLGATLITMPGFGETYVSPRIRLLIALAITVLLTPIIADKLPPLPAAPISLLMIVLGEILIGVFIGSVARLLMSALATGGAMLAFLSGLANAMLFNPLLSDQSALPSVFLSILGLLLIFATDTHHLMLMALLDSYMLFQPGVVPAFDDFSNTLALMLAESFRVGLQVAMPFVMFGIVFYTGMGLLARLMPQMPVFLVALPAQITLGLFLMLTTFPAALLWFLNYYQTTFTRLFLPG